MKLKQGLKCRIHFGIKPDDASICDLSGSSEKIGLFMSMFCGRGDVYAKRWETAKTGRSGYSPDCRLLWKYPCPKISDKSFKCADCQVRQFAKYDEAAVKAHLTGEAELAIYPTLLDETCRLICLDFNASEANLTAPKQHVAAILQTCREFNINAAVERTRNGEEFRLWLFFSEDIFLATARKFASSIIAHSMQRHHSLPFSLYTQIIPSQNNLPRGSFGNHIPLPLQKTARSLGNSVFVDENFDPYSDQWEFLAALRRFSYSEIAGLTERLSSDSLPPNFQERINITRSNMLRIEKSGLDDPSLYLLKRLAAFQNPDFLRAQKMRMPVLDKPRIIDCSALSEQYLSLPRGLENEICELLKPYGAKTNITDKTNHGREIDVSFRGELRGEQQAAADALLAHDNGVLSATTAFGKTVIGAYLIAERKVNTLILVHRNNLLAQWLERLDEFLEIREEPEIEYTPSGRPRKKKVIGQIGGGKTNFSGIVDVAVMQSLASKGEVKELVKDYGMVIADECHHVSAASFEQILRTVNAKYVYGLTATPTRQDGHHPIIFMQCGQIRYNVDAKQQAESRPFEHYLIPRYTGFQKPFERYSENWNYVDVCTDIQNSRPRNELIISDTLAAISEGRNPIILTERVEHVAMLCEMLSPNLENVFPLTGGKGAKQSKEYLERLANIPKGEPFAIVATGKYIGEGFDMPRLDTLLLAMPVSWTGTVQQYAGRLHRLFESKAEVLIYDYVDVYVPLLEKMYQKRLQSYLSIGYKIKEK